MQSLTSSEDRSEVLSNGQVSHTVAPAREYEPDPHCMHGAGPADSLNFPATQASHSNNFDAPAEYPAIHAQSEASSAPAADVACAGQLFESVPPSQYDPAGQI